MINEDDVKKAAQLSRLRLTSAEVARISGDLVRVVGYVEQLMAVDVTGVEPLVQPFAPAHPPRADVPAEVLGRRALEGSPGYQEGLVRVPQVVD